MRDTKPSNNLISSRATSRHYRKLFDRRGMTMAEVLIVLAILAVLFGLAFLAVANHQRTLAQLERDKVAKEIFIAAQNHLTPAYGQRYPGLVKYSEATKDEYDIESGYWDDNSDETKKGYYIVVHDGNAVSTKTGDVYTSGRGQKMLDIILPFGAIDETVRGGGSYVIKYSRDEGQVMEVFYCSKAGTKFGHDIQQTEYDTLTGLAGTGQKAARRNVSDWNNAVVGWYDGDELKDEEITPLKTSDLTVKNAEKLTVEIPDVNEDVTDSQSILLVTGVASGAQKYFSLERDSKDNVEYDATLKTHTVVLDDITSAGRHFADLFPIGSMAKAAPGGGATLTDAFIPGENLKLQVINFSNKMLATIQYSAEKTTNSLFWDVDKSGTNVVDTAYINNIRHLENLDVDISRVNKNGAGKQQNIINVVQIDDLRWTGSEDSFEGKIHGASIYKQGSSTPDTGTGYYLPVNLTSFTYDGKGHSISKIKVDSDNGGLFGTLKNSSVYNLELIDSEIKGNTTAGALAGAFKKEGNETTPRVKNIVAHNTSGDANNESRTVTGGIVGGLIGKMEGGSVLTSAAALTVSGSGNAGGLIGVATEGSIINHCYSGGHTNKGEYYKHQDGKRTDAIYNVTSSNENAGGLVGSTAATINNSYSTCSVKGKNKTGGFVGTGNGRIDNCYCTGLVKTDQITQEGAKDNEHGAFAGKFDGTVSNSMCFQIINEVILNEKNKETLDHYLGVVADAEQNGITYIDQNVGAYDDFVSTRNGGENKKNWAPANAYDSTIRKYYKLKYNLKTVRQLDTIDDADIGEGRTFVDTHYGDWPAPEVFIINDNN